MAAAAALALTGTALGTGAAYAADDPAVTDATLEWGLGGVYQEADTKGAACAFFSAGTGLDFSPSEGNVKIIKRGTDGAEQSVSRANICLPVEGRVMNQRAVFSGGTGTLDPETGAGTVSWEGAFTANAYNGMVPWWIQNPVLTVGTDGAGVLSATVGGRGASIEKPDEGFELTPREVTLAEFPSVEIHDGELTITPDFAGIEYYPLTVTGDPTQGRETETAIPDFAKQNTVWGSWPESLVDFHYESGLASYWHTSGGSADPLKAPLPITVFRDGTGSIGSSPVILENPQASAAAPFLEGTAVTFTASASDATSLRWERASSQSGPWTTIEGANEESFTIDPVTPEWNNTFIRMVASNAVGDSPSGTLRLSTVTPQDLTITKQPRDVIGIEGARPRIALSVTGVPGPTSFTVEESADGGTSWTAVDGIDVEGSRADRTILLPAAVMSDSDRLLRVTAATDAGVRVTSDTVAYRVVAATGEPQVALAPFDAIDPTVDNRVTVTGAGFTVPSSDMSGSYSVLVSLFADEDWQPGEEGSTNWTAVSADTEWGQLYEAIMRASGGSFTVDIDIPAGTLDADTDYGVATFLAKQGFFWDNSYKNRAADTFTRLQVATPEQTPEIPSLESVSDPESQTLTVEVTGERELSVSFSGEYPGTALALSLAGTDTSLGWVRVPAEGALTVALPRELAAGDYVLAAQHTNGEVTGHAPFTLAEVTTQPETGGENGENGGNGETGGNGGTTPGGTGSGAGTTGAETPGTLSLTGADLALPITAGVSLLIIGAGVLLMRRRMSRSGGDSA